MNGNVNGVCNEYSSIQHGAKNHELDVISHPVNWWSGCPDSTRSLEDPKFTIKQAMVITPYPGASAQQVEEEVTYKLENAIQELSYVDHVKSISKPGLSQITVEMKSIYREEHLHQIWDELRRKINDTKGQLPPGTSEPIIRDDFADVYGVMMAITGPDYSYKDIEHYADFYVVNWF